MNEITKQSGVASSTPPALVRWLQSKIMTRLGSAESQQKLWQSREKKRLADGRHHEVLYFHQEGDGYSDLAAQTLDNLVTRYDITLGVHLVTAEIGANTPELELLKLMSHRDAAMISPHYGLDHPTTLSPEQAMVLQDKMGGTDGSLQERQSAGNNLRSKLGHYSGAMFYYEGEWYWGVDRLYHLEARLKSLGADKSPDQPPLYPRPSNTVSGDASALTLEYYLSLRSPYTAVSWEPTMKLVRESGINLEIKPVLPMVMRGVPATRQKGIYIFKDAAREARAQGIIYGKFYDPIGDPVLKGYALYAWAETTGKGNDLLGSFLNAAFAEGINTNSYHGLRHIVEKAGLDWQEARNHLNDKEWHSELEQNRLSMYGFGSWGVPSYQLLDANGESVLAVWGQDRLWLVAKSIVDLITNKAGRQF